MRFLRVALAGLALMSSGLPGVMRAQSIPEPLRFEPLARERLFRLEAEQCGCSTFANGSELTDEAVVVSTTPLSARIVIEKRERELAHTSRKRVDEACINTFSSSGVTISVTSQQVPFRPTCATYPDPPPHGTCFVGSINLRAGNRVSKVQVIQLCGC